MKYHQTLTMIEDVRDLEEYSLTLVSNENTINRMYSVNTNECSGISNPE